MPTPDDDELTSGQMVLILLFLLSLFVGSIFLVRELLRLV